MSVKNPHNVDKHVGSRIRMRRMMIGMSQQKIADGLGLTFQQVQKYEKGVNRVGASRLQQISEILQVPVEWFFDGAATVSNGRSENALPDYTTAFLTSSEGLAIAKSFGRIPDVKVRRRIADLVEQLAGAA